MGQKSPSPGPKSDDLSYFNSFLRSQSVPRTLDLNTPPMMAAGLRNDEQVNKMVNSNLAARGRVRSMVIAIEHEERGRANTLPANLTADITRSSSTNPMLSAGGSPVVAGAYGSSPVGAGEFLNGHARSSHLASQDEPPHQNSGDGIGKASPISRGTQQSPMSRQLLTVAKEPWKLSTTFEASVEESVSYVKLHPPVIENGSTVLPEEEEEEGEGGKRKGSRTEEVFLSLIPRDDDDDDVIEGSCDGVDTPELDFSEERVNGKSISSSPLLDDTSDELDRPPMDGGQNDSLLNLYQVEEEGSPQMGVKHKKKRRWKLFRKRKSTEEQEIAKAERSQSDAPLKSEGVEGFGGAPAELQEVILRNKMRSISHETFLGSGRGRRDRYTVYMEPYSSKLEERKKLSPNREGEGLSTSQGSGLDEVDRGSTNDMLDRAGDATPPAEMTPMTFKQSLFCNQLKYKLRSALQNVHIPLSLNHALNPAFQQLQMGEELKFDARYQLIVLIQHALQRSQWKQDDMETALLTEILRMVEPLPSDL